jgi:F0F1-type ATP synthase membrane subunit b/b'
VIFNLLPPLTTLILEHLLTTFLLVILFQVKDLIIGAFDNRRTKIASELHQIEGQYSLTADMWTSMNQDAFLAVLKR